MSTPTVIRDTRIRARKVEESFRFIAKVEEDEENAQIDEDCAAWFEKFQPSKVKQEQVASEHDVATQAVVDARRKQLFEQFEKQRQLITDQVQPEEMIGSNYDNFDEVRGAGREQEHVDISIDNRTKEFALPLADKGSDRPLEATMAFEEKSKERQCSPKDHFAIPARDNENRLSLLPHYLPSALEYRGNFAESELDRLSRQVQVLVHQLAGCRQNLLRAEVEVGVLHEENRELRSLIKDLLAAYSSP